MVSRVKFHIIFNYFSYYNFQVIKFNLIFLNKKNSRLYNLFFRSCRDENLFVYSTNIKCLQDENQLYIVQKICAMAEVLYLLL